MRRLRSRCRRFGSRDVAAGKIGRQQIDSDRLRDSDGRHAALCVLPGLPHAVDPVAAWSAIAPRGTANMKFTKDQAIVIVAATLVWVLAVLSCYLMGLASHELISH